MPSEVGDCIVSEPDLSREMDIGVCDMEVTSLLYQFLVGGIFFTVGVVIPWRAGDYSWQNRGDRRLLLAMLATCVFYLTLQSAWHLYAGGVG